MAEAAVAEGIEAVVLAEDDRAETADPEVFIGGVGEGVPVVASVACDTLMKLGVGFAVHGEACLDGCNEERGVIEAVFPREDKLLFCRLRGQFGIGRD